MSVYTHIRWPRGVFYTAADPAACPFQSVICLFLLHQLMKTAFCATVVR
jgi:hypothetical protein